MRIKIPFHDRFKIEIAAGRKIYTTRTKRYGKEGDTFQIAPKIKCRIISIRKERLGTIAEKLWWQEGFRSREEFIGFWLMIHRKWTPEKMVWLHRFERV